MCGQLGEAKIFTILDANKGFWQMAIDPLDYEKTAFITHHGLYEWRRMPFGLVNAPETFQRALDVILSKYKWKTCLVYIDDVVIFSDTEEQHIARVDEILQTLGDAGV